MIMSWLLASIYEGMFSHAAYCKTIIAFGLHHKIIFKLKYYNNIVKNYVTNTK